MAIAKAEITISRIVDIASVTRYYKLQSSTASAPARPTTNPPSGWTTAEPSYTSGSTNTLYFVDLTVFTNGTFSYSTVSKSSSYEAAKEAYNKAQAAGDAASDANDKIDNLEVGGRNYIRNLFGKRSDTLNGITVEYLDNEFHIHGTNTKTSGAYGVGMFLEQKTDGSEEPLLSPGETYTLSSTAPVQEGMYYQLNSQKASDNTNIAVSTIGAGKTSNTFVVPTDCSGYATHGFFGIKGAEVTDVDVTFKLKLEKGNKATDWTPAPEDMATQDAVENAQNSADNAQISADNAQNTANSNIDRLNNAESSLEILNNSIKSLIVDKNGKSMMTQTSDGWCFNIGAINSTLNEAVQKLDSLQGSMSEVDNAVSNLESLANDIGEKTAYIVMTTDDSGAPCIELGKDGNPFKVRITNTSVDFMDGLSKIAYVSNQALYIERAIIKQELQIGENEGFVWKKRANGNLGLRVFASNRSHNGGGTN